MTSSSSTGFHQRQEIQAAIAKAVELRALHAALLNGSSPAAAQPLRSPIAAVLRGTGNHNQLSADDYPVFNPSYEEEHLPGYHHILSENRRASQNFSDIGLTGEANDDASVISDNRTESGYPSLNGDQHICSANDSVSNGGSLLNDLSKRRIRAGDCKTVASRNRCKPATISRESNSDYENPKNFGNVAPSTVIQSSMQSQTKSRGTSFSWLFHKVQKKSKSEMSPNTMDSENMSQLLKEWSVFSLESLKKDLLEANENRDAALQEVAEMKSTMNELKVKLASLESYCEEMKKALKQAVKGKESQFVERSTLSKTAKAIGGSRDTSLPVSHEVMVEGFLQIVSEARLSIRHFCKTLINQIEETDEDLMSKLNSLLHPYQITSSNKYSKGVQYHLEALINQHLYQDFENCIFQKNGSPKILDPQQDRQENFSAFVALRNLSLKEVLRKGSKYYGEEFSRFCDQKMNAIVSELDWSRPWPELLLHSFFVAAKCIWLVHLLAFSFNPPLVILRADENRDFDQTYMEDILGDKHQGDAPARVKIMVMPGFYVQDRVLRCKVLCRYRTIP